MAEYLDLAQVAEMLGVDRDAAYVLVRKGELRAIKISAGWRVARTDVVQYKDSR